MAFGDVGMTEVEKKAHVNDLNKRIKELEADWEKVRCAFLQAVERAEKAEERNAALEKGLRKLGCKLIEAQTASTTGGRQNALMLEAREHIDTLLNARIKSDA